MRPCFMLARVRHRQAGVLSLSLSLPLSISLSLSLTTEEGVCGRALCLQGSETEHTLWTEREREGERERKRDGERDVE